MGYNSAGYVFEIGILVEYLFIGVGLFLVYMILKRCISKPDVLVRTSWIFIVLYISLIPLSFVAAYVLNDIPWEKTDVSEQYISDIEVTSYIQGNRRRVYENTYYQYWTVEGYLYKIPANATKLSVNLDNATKVITYDLHRDWLLWWQEDTRYEIR